LYGRAEDAHIRAERVDATWPARMSFDLVVGSERRHVQTRLVGTLLLPSVLAALAVVHALGLDMEAAVARLATINPFSRRLSVKAGESGHTFVLDNYKASYWSTLALVEDIEHWGPARRIFVLGEMSDIRHESSRRYRQVMRSLSERAALVIGIGRAETAARKVNLPNVVPAATVRDIAEILSHEPPSVVILKSNRTVPLGSLVPGVAG
ncbi:MAG TPA: hypothetical protein VFE52_08355, partial [Devosia sp.]|nr:hypothetical protein [Devosia sp.]